MGRKSGRIRTAARAMGAISALAVARSVALFVGAYSLASTVAGALSRTQSQDLWWIDLRFVPSMVGLVVAWLLGDAARVCGRAQDGGMAARC